MAEPLWSVERRGALKVVRCSALDLSGVTHVFTTAEDRRGGAFDVGAYDAGGGDEPWRETVLAAAGLTGRRLCDPRQTHGARVIGPPENRHAADADGVVAFAGQGRAPAPAVRTADCVPLLLASADGRALGAIHAGWRGTAAGIVDRALEKMAEGGVRPEELVATLGPAIGICCFRVGEEVLAAMAARFGSLAASCTRSDREGSRLGLSSLIRSHLIRRGLAAEAVHAAPWCTSCSDLPLFSYRRQGKAAGRQLACLGWRTA